MEIAFYLFQTFSLKGTISTQFPLTTLWVERERVVVFISFYVQRTVAPKFKLLVQLLFSYNFFSITWNLRHLQGRSGSQKKGTCNFPFMCIENVYRFSPIAKKHFLHYFIPN